MSARPLSLRWLPAKLPHLSVATAAILLAASVLGLSQIAVTRRVIRDAARQRVVLDAKERAAAMGLQVESLRGELAFLARSPTMEGLPELLTASDTSESRWRRVAAEGALLLLLRAHPEALHVEIAARGSFVRAARRGNVPVVWSAAVAGPAAAAARAPSGELSLALPLDPAGAPGWTVRVGLDPDAVLAAAMGPASGCACALADGAGRRVAGDATPRAGAGSAHVPGSAGWGPAAPWTLTCWRDGSDASGAGAAERAALALGIAGIVCSMLLAGLGLQEGHRRRLVESGAAERERLHALEHQLLHAERLGTVGRLAAGLAHEVNNPLEGMANYLSLARAAHARGDRDAVERHLGGIGRGLGMASTITRQVLDLAEPAGAPRSDVDVAAVVGDTVAFVAGRPDAGAIRIAGDVPAGLTVRAHEVLLRQVLLNLIVNACEAQPGGGEVDVSARCVTGDLRIDVADRGPGVPPEARERIFEPFYTTKGSTGLGLALVHAIVQRHGGSLAVADRAGGGAVFSVTLPGAAPREPRPALLAARDRGRP